MDFGLVGMEGMVGGGDPSGGGGGDHGSGKIKQERSGLGEETWRLSKAPRTCSSEEDLNGVNPTSLLLRSGDNNGRGHTTMLSFSSSSKSEEIPFLSVNGEDSSASISIPFFQSQPKQGLPSVYAPGGVNEATRGGFSLFRGPFTPSQWMELEHQALIYKHLVTNVPIPSSLLVSLKKSLSPYTFSGLSSRPYASNWGWGPFHLGFAGNTDPEPGRCRRTDGKKWRCSRDAVPDQKYCERHINRGRHRSRKPVEGQTGRAASGTAASKAVPVVASSSSSAPVIPSGGGASNSFSAVQHQFKSMQQCPANPSTDHLTSNRTQGLSVISPSMNLKSKDSAISIQKQQNPLEESSARSEFGFLSSDSLLNLSQKSHVNSKNSGTLDFNCHVTNEQHPVHHFTDIWTKEQSGCDSVSWPELKPDWTQLSMSSIPMTASNFSSSSSSPRQENTSNWLPVSWGNSMGGPLGEALNSTSGGSAGSGKNSSNLNLMTEAWDSNPHLGSPPPADLQKSDLCLTLKQQFGGKQSQDDKKTTAALEDGMGDEVIGSNLVSSVYSINVCL
ncbi:PREDICTED: growth-regulating factor 2-like isoform X2 [Ipomoea nil]|uniref:growth-regulating factor 2-like isoform X2 n=1 Tax=Ipomoea nil TaxID=35883 RepID=UPI000901CB34|nr:PREDICTED: growth-regulating factor 2-like isoform X2 [Ipomoea nil]